MDIQLFESLVHRVRAFRWHGAEWQRLFPGIAWSNYYNLYGVPCGYEQRGFNPVAPGMWVVIGPDDKLDVLDNDEFVTRFTPYNEPLFEPLEFAPDALPVATPLNPLPVDLNQFPLENLSR